MSAAEALLYVTLGAAFGYAIAWAACKLMGEDDSMMHSERSQFEDDAAVLRREVARYRRHIYATGAILLALVIVVMLVAVA